MVRTMKRIVSFLILLALFIVILTLPAAEAPAAPEHSVPVWPILLYLGMVAAAALGVARQIRGRGTREKRKNSENRIINYLTGSV